MPMIACSPFCRFDLYFLCVLQFSVFKFRGLVNDWGATCNPSRPQLHSLFSSFEDCYRSNPCLPQLHSLFSSFEGCYCIATQSAEIRFHLQHILRFSTLSQGTR